MPNSSQKPVFSSEQKANRPLLSAKLNNRDLITVQGFDTSAGKVERLELNNGKFLTDANINQVIADMAAYAATNSISFNSLSDVENNAGLLAIVNGGWHT